MMQLLHQLAEFVVTRSAELSAAPLDGADYSMAWAWVIPVATALIGAYSSNKAAKEQNAAAKEAAKSRETTQTQIPYMNEYISKLVPYILAEQQKVFESRMKGYGLKAGDFSPIAQMLSGINPGYSGVAGVGNYGTWGQQYNPFSEKYGVPSQPKTPEEAAAIRARFADRQPGGDVVDGSRGGMRQSGVEEEGGAYWNDGGGFLNAPVDERAANDAGDWLLQMLGFGGGGSGQSDGVGDGFSRKQSRRAL